MKFEIPGHYTAYRLFSIYIGRDAQPDDFTLENINAFAVSEKKVARILPKTLANHLSSLRVISRKHGHHIPVTIPKGIEDLPSEEDGQLTLWGMFEKHYRPRRLIGKSKNTARLYRTTVRKFSKYLGRSAMLTDLTDELVASYLDCLSTQISMNSVVKEYDQLMALWRFATRRKLVELYPDLMRPTAPKPVPDAFTHDELHRLIGAARAWPGDYFDVPAGLWWEAMIRLCYDCGERVGAILKIKPEHLQGDWVLIPAQSRKGAQQGKRFRVSKTTKTMLAKIASLQTQEMLFAWPKHYTYFWVIFGRVLVKAGLPNERRGKWHKIRRSVATFYEAKGGNATELLGHSSRRVTEAYLDNRFIEKPQPCDLIEPL